MLSQSLGRLMLILLGSVAMLPVAAVSAAPAGSVTPLERPVLPGYIRARGISADGSTVVGFSDIYGAAYSAVGWSSSGTVTYYPVGKPNSSAQAISADGSTVVGDYFAFGVGDGAFVINGGNVYYLPVLSGFQGNGATGVSADGSVWWVIARCRAIAATRCNGPAPDGPR